ncbi:MAG: thiamine-phosphate kinase [Phycisphaerales bacterium]|nr:thiamine-phosphate kinase [Phycisphaerales bacterium]MCB9855581.1 thiamine-phosphate kinase [Phycisphaerales bacterium]
MQKSEDNLIAWIADRVGNSANGIVGIGDDMAILNVGDETILTAADMLLDGVHFDTRRHSPRQIGRKALAVNLSDCAAMAVRPWAALVSVALPADWSMELAQELFEGLSELADAFDCRLIGGDTNSWHRPLAIDVTILARPYDNLRPVQRRGAVPGDAVFVTGRLGGSLASHQMTFTPRVNEARQLSTVLGADLHAMMDLSDGLSTDARRMACAAGVGMVFDRAQLLGVASDTARMSAADNDALLASIVGDGEDFELLFATSADRTSDVPDRIAIQQAGVADTPITCIGKVVEESGIWLQSTDGARKPLEPAGWQHFR